MTATLSYQPTEDQKALRDSVRRFLAEHSPTMHRQLLEGASGLDDDLWRRMTGELGLSSLLIPEAYGGFGASVVELALVLEETGRALAQTPLFSTAAMATPLLLALDGDGLAAELLSRLALGSTAAVAVGVDRTLTPSTAVHAAPGAGGWVLSGEAPFVIDGASADTILVAARANDGIGIFVVESNATGLVRTPMRTFDLTRAQATLEFSSVPARPLGDLDGGASVLVAWLDLVCTLLSSEQIGGAQRCLDDTVTYVQTREQFGQPIGSFQAVKHRCADVYLEIESARTASMHAVRVAASALDQLATVAPIAKASASEAFVFAAAENVHLHGGIGFTWEHDAHLYYRRAQSSAVLFGSPAAHRELLVSRLGL